jgi:hypothetical protein
MQVPLAASQARVAQADLVAGIGLLLANPSLSLFWMSAADALRFTTYQPQHRCDSLGGVNLGGLIKRSSSRLGRSRCAARVVLSYRMTKRSCKRLRHAHPHASALDS